MLREDYEYLKQFESNFRTAINSNYSRNIAESHLNRMVEIYSKEIGKSHKICIRCGTVVLNFLKDLGKIYYKVQEGFEDNMKINKLDETVTDKDNERGIKEDGNNPKQDKECKVKGDIKKKSKSSSRAKK
jgi:hypothetical protein